MSTNSLTTGAESTPANTTSSEAKPKRFHPLLVTLHWLIAILIVAAFFLAQGGGDGGERGRFRPGQGNFPPQGQGFQQQGDQQPLGGGDDEAPPSNFQPQVVPGTQSGGNQPQQGFPQGGFPQQGNQGILSTIGIHMIFGLTVLVLLIVRLIVRWTTKHPEWSSAGNKFLDWVGVLTHWGLYLLTFGMVITGIILADQRGQLARTFGIGSVPVRGSFQRGGFSLGFLHGGIWILLLLLILLHVGAALYHQFIVKDNLLARMWYGKKTE
jgi:cytochrome b561